MRTTTNTICALMLNMAIGAIIAAIAGIPVIAGMIGMAVAGILLGLMPKPAGALRTGVCVEIWTGEIVKKLYTAQKVPK